MVEQAKSRVAAVKESLGEKAAGAQTPPTAAPGAPKAPVKKKEEGPKPVDASNMRWSRNLKLNLMGRSARHWSLSVKSRFALNLLVLSTSAISLETIRKQASIIFQT